MKHKDSAAKMAAFPVSTAAKMAAFPVNTAAKMAAFPVRRGSYQQPSATRQKKAEAKKRKSPCTPFREKAKGKESDRRVLSRNRLSRADARATAREEARTGARHGGGERRSRGDRPTGGRGHAGRVTLPRLTAALDADLDTAVGAFEGSAEDRRIWASIAWRVGVEAFHFALMDKLAEDAADGTQNIRCRAAAFQAFLNERFPKPEATRVSLPRMASRAKGGAA